MSAMDSFMWRVGLTTASRADRIARRSGQRVVRRRGARAAVPGDRPGQRPHEGHRRGTRNSSRDHSSWATYGGLSSSDARFAGASSVVRVLCVAAIAPHQQARALLRPPDDYSPREVHVGGESYHEMSHLIRLNQAGRDAAGDALGRC